ncbi:ACT domain-containing protein [Erythrobacter rubeus]|uniref:ACT domain-containing protein n=1 Tax=Erythrobacter rubeus TaxID=2760803 RepID=A0ABR8KS49_9SPHN|nr:ACT domain-containing protein [Erythrobacter rubeus]MBD2842789.1 ACT domain-containing protein [Erythrobacter rubeus]
MVRLVSNLADMLAGLKPELCEDHGWAFRALAADEALPADAFAVIRETEGLCAIIPAAAGDHRPIFARITLQVHSDVEGVGLTAAVSQALAQEGIACNVIAGLHHDHLFVPWERRGAAMVALKKRRDDARR